MAISFHCPHCDHEIRVKSALAGKKGKCPACGKPVTVPTAGKDLATRSPGRRKKSSSSHEKMAAKPAAFPIQWPAAAVGSACVLVPGLIFLFFSSSGGQTPEQNQNLLAQVEPLELTPIEAAEPQVAEAELPQPAPQPVAQLDEKQKMEEAEEPEAEALAQVEVEPMPEMKHVPEKKSAKETKRPSLLESQASLLKGDDLENWLAGLPSFKELSLEENIYVEMIRHRLINELEEIHGVPDEDLHPELEDLMGKSAVSEVYRFIDSKSGDYEEIDSLVIKAYNLCYNRYKENGNSGKILTAIVRPHPDLDPLLRREMDFNLMSSLSLREDFNLIGVTWTKQLPKDLKRRERIIPLQDDSYAVIDRVICYVPEGTEEISFRFSESYHSVKYRDWAYSFWQPAFKKKCRDLTIDLRPFLEKEEVFMELGLFNIELEE